MPVSVITSKGQTTIPREVRDALRVEAGDRIVYEIVGNAASIRSARTMVDDLDGILCEPGRRPVDLEAAREAFRRHVATKAGGGEDE